jgi:hypothetical protein
LETKALVKTGIDSYTIDYDKREKIETKPNTEKHPIQHYFDIIDCMRNFLYVGTGHKLEQYVSYDPNHVRYSEHHRIKILKCWDTNQIYNFENNMDLILDLVQSWFDLSNHELAERGEIAPDRDRDDKLR